MGVSLRRHASEALGRWQKWNCTLMHNHVLTSQKGETCFATRVEHILEFLMCVWGYFTKAIQYDKVVVFAATKKLFYTQTRSFARTSSQDIKPLSCIPLLGCVVEERPLELHQRPGFCLTQSDTAHTFSWENTELKDSWMAVLAAAVTGKVLDHTRDNFVPCSQFNVKNGQMLCGDEC